MLHLAVDLITQAVDAVQAVDAAEVVEVAEAEVVAKVRGSDYGCFSILLVWLAQC